MLTLPCFFFFFFNDTATTEIYTLSLHDALPISNFARPVRGAPLPQERPFDLGERNDRIAMESYPQLRSTTDRKSTRLNSSHLVISYAVFCLKKKQHNASDLISSYRTHQYALPSA